MSDATRRAAVAERAARAGGVVARESFRSSMTVETKVDKNDLVTDADRDTQRQVIATIAQEFPDPTFVCEEAATPQGTADTDMRNGVPESGDAWIVDPIDGTGNFVRGVRFWTTSVAAVVDGNPIAVANFLPAEEDIYTAGPESVICNGSTMTVSERDDPETFAVGLIGPWPSILDERGVGILREAADRFGDFRRLGSMQGVLSLVASGSLDAAFTTTQPLSWDAMAGVHLIRRAGGVATDAAGEPWSIDSESLVVSNGECHEAVLAVAGGTTSVETAD